MTNIFANALVEQDLANAVANFVCAASSLVSSSAIKAAWVCRQIRWGNTPARAGIPGRAARGNILTPIPKAGVWRFPSHNVCV